MCVCLSYVFSQAEEKVYLLVNAITAHSRHIEDVRLEERSFGSSVCIYKSLLTVF